MASNKPPARKLAGIRASCPSGYMLGRVSSGEGDVELLTLKRLQSAGLAPTSLPGPPTGLAGGDLTGSYPDPTVRGLRGRNISNVAPMDKNVLAWDNAGTAWAPLALGAVAYTSAYVDLTGAPPAGSYLPTGGTAGQVLTKIDATNYNVNWQTPSGGGGSGSNAASIQDDGTTVYIALSDGDGLLVLDGAGDPIFMPEVFPVSAIPIDGTTIIAVAGLMKAVAALPAALLFVAQLSANQGTTAGAWNKVIFDTFITNSLGTQYAVGTGKFTPTKAGKYLIFATLRGTATGTIVDTTISITKNGTWPGTGTQQSFVTETDSGGGAGGGSTPFAFAFVDMNGSTDWVEADGRLNSLGGSGTLNFVGTQCFFGALYLGA